MNVEGELPRFSGPVPDHWNENLNPKGRTDRPFFFPKKGFLMLVISRHTNETIILTDQTTGQKIKIVVVDTKSERVRIGIEAPRNVTVLREELEEIPRNA